MLKDIRAGKSKGPVPDMNRINLKLAQSNSKKNKPSMPKMPWDK